MMYLLSFFFFFEYIPPLIGITLATPDEQPKLKSYIVPDYPCQD